MTLGKIMSGRLKISWIVAGAVFVVASLAIQYEVKVVMPKRGVGLVKAMGNLRVGRPAPDFTLTDLAGHSVTLSAARGKKVVLLDFWATWCGPCRMSMPGLEKLRTTFKGRGFALWSVNEGEPADHVRRFIASQHCQFHVLLDSDGGVGNRYGVQAIPTLVLVDKQGVVRWIRVGYAPNEDALKPVIRRLVHE